MKKKILGATFMVAVMAVAGYNMYMSQSEFEMSELAMANVEALAYPEGGNGKSSIQGKCKNSDISIMECKVLCPKCQETWYPSPRFYKATAYDVSGHCSCGYSNWDNYNN